jgi:hypothetical protein
VVFQQDVLTVAFYHVREKTELGFELVEEALVEEDFFKLVGSSFFDNLAVVFVGDELVAVANAENFECLVLLKGLEEIFAHGLNLRDVGEHGVSAAGYDNAIKG